MKATTSHQPSTLTVSIPIHSACPPPLLPRPTPWLELLLFSCSVVSYSLWLHGLQHARLPCPSLFSRVCSNSSPLSQWYHPTISSSVTPFSYCPQWPKYWSFSFSISPSNEGWFPLRLTGLISLLVQGTLKSFLQRHSLKASVLWHSAFFVV